MSDMKQISNSIDNILLELTNPENPTSKELGKLLYYNESNPLEQKDILNLSDLIADKSSLCGENAKLKTNEKKILPFPCATETLEEASCVLSVYLGLGRSRQLVLQDCFIHIDILVHMYLWKIDGGIRTYEIMDRVLEILKLNKNIGGINKLGLQHVDTVYRQDSKNYFGYSMVFKVTNLQGRNL